MNDKQDVMLSIRPFYVGEIEAGVKEIEVRKTRPKQDPPFKCYVYETQAPTEIPWQDEDGHLIFKGRGTVVLEFICDRIDTFTTVGDAKHECTISDEAMHRGSCLTEKELHDYEFSTPINDHFGLYGWHISDLKVYKKPYPLSDFCTGSSRFTFNSEGRTVYTGMTRAPQSWCYVDDADPLRGERE